MADDTIFKHLKEVQETFVKDCFARYKNGDQSAVTYHPHAVTEMLNDSITSRLLEECMPDSELIGFNWESRHSRTVKMIFLCTPHEKPAFHVVCFVKDAVLIRTVYEVDPLKFRNNKYRI